VSDLLLAGFVVGAALALRALAEPVVVIWSLRADKEGRRHAIRLLEQLSAWRRRKPP
jgi:hypothetical protein